MKNQFLVLLFIANQVNAQQWPPIYAQFTIGGSNLDLLSRSFQTTGGQYFNAGSSASGISFEKAENSFGLWDFWLTKTDDTGLIFFQNTINADSSDILTVAEETPDGGFLLGGSSNSSATMDKTEPGIGGFDYWIVKISSANYIQWQNTIGGNDDDYLVAVDQTTDGGFIFGGHSISDSSTDKSENNKGLDDFWLVKTDGLGNVLWDKTIGGDSDDWLADVQQTDDGGYILAGYSASGISGDKTEGSNGLFDYWLVKLDATGAVEWQNTIGGFNTDVLTTLEQAADGGFLIGGYSTSPVSGDKTEDCNGADDFWIVKTDSTGSIEWQNTIGGSESDWLHDIYIQPNGYYLAGYSESGISGDKNELNQGGTDYWLIRIDEAGNILWQSDLGGAQNDILHSVNQTTAGKLVLGGYSNSGITGDKSGICRGFFDYWVVTLEISALTTLTGSQFGKELAVHVYPNPVSDQLNIDFKSTEAIQLRIVSTIGETVFNQYIQYNPTSLVQIDVRALASGYYGIEITGNNNHAFASFVKAD